MKRSSDFFRSLIFCFLIINISLPALSFAEGIADTADQDSVLKQKNTIKQPVYTTSRLVTEEPVIYFQMLP